MVLTNWALFVAGILVIAIGIIAAINSDVSRFTALLAAGLTLLLAATIDRFESLKGLGLEAKTRKLDQKLVEADDALKRFKELAEIVGSSLVDLNSKIGRWSSAPGVRESYALAQKVRRILTSLDSDVPTLHNALSPWVKVCLLDLSRAITAPLDKLINKKIQDVSSKLYSFKQPLRPDDPEYLAVLDESRALGSYEQKLRNLHELELREFPDRLIALIEKAPSISVEDLDPIKLKAQQFAPIMIELIDKLYLANPEPFFAEIEEFSKGDL